MGSVNVLKDLLALLAKEVISPLPSSILVSWLPLLSTSGVCPNDCNGKGFCQTMRDLSVYSWKGVEYSNWDSISTNICECDDSYFGYDCSQIMCPKGDDPLTPHSNYKTIQLRVTGPTGFSGKLGIRFQGVTSYISISIASNEVCKTQLETSKKFREISCTYSMITHSRTNVHTFVISFLSWPVTPQENNIHSHNGNPSPEEFSCDTSGLDSSLVTCSFTDLISEDIPGE